MTRLVVRFGVRATESLRTYVLRLSEANGYADPLAVRRAAGLPATFAARPCDLTGLVAAVGGLADHGTLEGAASWQDAAGLVGLGATRLSPALVSFSRPRICVPCVAEGRSVEPAWDVVGCAACPRHRTVLTDACTCGRALGWNRPGLARCRCGLRLHAGTADVPASIIDLAGTLIGLSRGEAGRHEGLPLTSLDAFAHLVRFLGCEGSTPMEWRSGLMTKSAIAGSLAAAGRAAPALADWPHGWRTWLLAPGRFGARAAASAERSILHRRLRSLLSRPGLEAMLDQTRRIIMEGPHGPLLKASDFLHTDRAQATYVRGTVAARRLGVCTSTVAALIERSQLVGESRLAGRRRAHVLPVADVEAAVSARASAYRAAEAARRLDVTVPVLAALRRAGLLPALRGLPGSRGEIRYSRAGVADLLDRIAARTTTGLRPGDVSLKAVAERRYARFVDVVSAVLEGDLSARTSVTPVKGMGDVYVADRDALRLRHRRSEECLNVREAASRLNLSVRMIPILVGAGCLEVHDRLDGPLGRCSVTERSVAAFPRHYAPASAYAASWRTNTQTAIARLRAAGAIAVVEADTRRGISSVWRRNASKARCAPMKPRTEPVRSAPLRPSGPRRGKGRLEGGAVRVGRVS